jgi:hypothetical protein
MTRDRTYFRMLSDTALADAARYCDNDLALVLGERLHDLLDVDDELEAARDTIKELQLKVDLLTCELHDMEGTNLV